jgi:hypothetical protein
MAEYNALIQRGALPLSSFIIKRTVPGKIVQNKIIYARKKTTYRRLAPKKGVTYFGYKQTKYLNGIIKPRDKGVTYCGYKQTKYINGVIKPRTYQTCLLKEAALGYFDIDVKQRYIYLDQRADIYLKPKNETAPFKYSVWLNDKQIIPAEDTYTSMPINFSFTSEDLEDGYNNVVIKFSFETQAPLDAFLSIIKEPFKRNSINREIFRYFQSNYTINNLKNSFNNKYDLLVGSADNGFIETTELTSIPVHKYLGIQNIVSESDKCLYLISFDKRHTWYGIDKKTGTFMLCSPKDILTYGINTGDLPAITRAQWSSVFEPDFIDFYIYLPAASAYFKSLTVNMIPNYKPEVKNAQLSLAATHKDNLFLSATIKDLEGDQAYYSIFVNGAEYIPLTQNGNSEYDIEVEIPHTELKLGTNSIEIFVSDLAEKGIAWSGYVTKESKPAEIIGTIDYNNLKAIVNDTDGDNVKYRILVNNKVRQEWSNFIPVPFDIKYRINREDIKIGYANTVTVELTDDLGQPSAVDFDFIGQNFGLIFLDDNMQPYVDHLGNTVGTFSTGYTSTGEETKKQLFILNNTNTKVHNIKVWIQEGDNNEITTLLSEDNSLYVNKLDNGNKLEVGEVYGIWVKTSASLNAIEKEDYAIFVSGDVDE